MFTNAAEQYVKFKIWVVPIKFHRQKIWWAYTGIYILNLLYDYLLSQNDAPNLKKFQNFPKISTEIRF